MSASFPAGQNIDAQALRTAFPELSEGQRQTILLLMQTHEQADFEIPGTPLVLEKEIELKVLDDNGQMLEVEGTKKGLNYEIVVDIESDSDAASEDEQIEVEIYNAPEMDLGDAIVELINGGRLTEAQKAKIRAALKE